MEHARLLKHGKRFLLFAERLQVFRVIDRGLQFRRLLRELFAPVDGCFLKLRLGSCRRAVRAFRFIRLESDVLQQAR